MIAQPTDMELIDWAVEQLKNELQLSRIFLEQNVKFQYSKPETLSSTKIPFSPYIVDRFLRTPASLSTRGTNLMLWMQ